PDRLPAEAEAGDHGYRLRQVAERLPQVVRSDRAHGLGAHGDSWSAEAACGTGAVIAVGRSRRSYSRRVTSFSAGSANMPRNRSVTRERSASCWEANRYT